MNAKILNKLCCPMCKGELSLTSFLEENVECPQHGTMSEGSQGEDDRGGGNELSKKAWCSVRSVTCGIQSMDMSLSC